MKSSLSLLLITSKLIYVNLFFSLGCMQFWMLWYDTMCPMTNNNVLCTRVMWDLDFKSMTQYYVLLPMMYICILVLEIHHGLARNVLVAFLVSMSLGEGSWSMNKFVICKGKVWDISPNHQEKLMPTNYILWNNFVE